MANREHSGPGVLGGLDKQRAKELQQLKDLARADNGEERNTQRADYDDQRADEETASSGRGRGNARTS